MFRLGKWSKKPIFWIFLGGIVMVFAGCIISSIVESRMNAPTPTPTATITQTPTRTPTLTPTPSRTPMNTPKPQPSSTPEPVRQISDRECHPCEGSCITVNYGDPGGSNCHIALVVDGWMASSNLVHLYEGCQYQKVGMGYAPKDWNPSAGERVYLASHERDNGAGNRDMTQVIGYRNGQPVRCYVRNVLIDGDR